MSNKVIIHISGNSCTGKTTVNDILFDRIPGVYLVSHDKMKWLLSGYHRDKNKDIMVRLEKGFFDVVCKEGLPVLLEFFIRTKKDYDYFIKIAKKHGYKFYFFKLVCPENLLLERYHKRVESAKKKNVKISVRSVKNFLENNKNEAYFPKDVPVFDTSKVSATEIANIILKKLS